MSLNRQMDLQKSLGLWTLCDFFVQGHRRKLCQPYSFLKKPLSSSVLTTAKNFRLVFPPIPRLRSLDHLDCLNQGLPLGSRRADYLLNQVPVEKILDSDWECSQPWPLRLSSQELTQSRQSHCFRPSRLHRRSLHHPDQANL